MNSFPKQRAGGMTASISAAPLLTAFTFLISGLLFIAPALSAVAAAPVGALKAPELKYEKYVLPNGLVVLTHEDHRLPLVAVDLWYHVGPLNERAGRTGFAHLFEHMMFEGSEHVGEKAHIKFVQGAGASDVNGTTNFDRTNYFETMPSNQLELALWLESDRMGFLLEGLDREKLTNQRDVVRNERRQGEGSPYALAGQEMYHQLFPKEHPYYASVIGSHADIEAARIKDVREFHQQFYTPNNASIAIAGDFDPAQLKTLLTKYFGPIPAGPKVEEVTSKTVPTPPITTQKRVTVTDTVKLDRVSIGFLMPAAYAPGDAEAQLLGTVLGGAEASRLDKELEYKRQWTQGVSCGARPLKLVSVFQCSLTAKPGVKLEDLEAAFWTEVEKLQKDGPTQEELDAARTADLTRKIAGLQRLGGFGGVADTLDSYFQYTGDPGYLSKDIHHFESVTVASMKQVAGQYLNQNQAVVIDCVPGKKVVDDVPRSPADIDKDVALTAPYTPEFENQQDWRKSAPGPGPALTFKLPVPSMFSLKNGLKVYFVEQPGLPIVTASLVSRAGGEANTADKAGIASFTAHMLTEGTDKYSASQVAEAADRLGTSLAVEASMDGATAGVTVLTNHADEAMDLLAEVVRHPAFRAEDMERIRKRTVVGIQQESDSVGAIADRVGPKVLYGDQPYGISRSGTVATVGAMTAEELRAFWASHYGPEDSALIFAGDVNEAEAKKLAERAFGDWSGMAKVEAGEMTLPPAPAAPSLKIVLIDKPGSPQTGLEAYGLGVPRTAPDLQAIQLMDYTLGASFGSRINMNLREVHGYTYGASAVYSFYREGGPFDAGGLVKTDVTAASLKELMLELRRIQTEPPTAAELKMARDARIQSIPSRFDTTNKTAGEIASLFLYNWPLDYYRTLPEKYQAVTLEAVAKAARDYVHPENLVVVAAGDRAKIQPELEKLELGPMEFRDASGDLIQK